MEQLNQTLLSFETFAKGDDDVVVPFSLRVFQPAYDEGRGFYCVLECSFLRKKPFMIFGVDEEQASELSISFIRQSIKDQNAHLVDGHGNKIFVPDISRDAIHFIDPSKTDVE